jgi:hypothetical protein
MRSFAFDVRCVARTNRADTQDYFQRMTQLGDFYCGSDLVYARKLTT